MVCWKLIFRQVWVANICMKLKNGNCSLSLGQPIQKEKWSDCSTHNGKGVWLQNSGIATQRPSVQQKGTGAVIGNEQLRLATKFIQEFGEPVSVWLQKQKNQKILSRLSYDSISIKEIAHEFGFLSASSFNKYCKCNFGYNPTELKNR
mgnify:CR=1 FL=1